MYYTILPTVHLHSIDFLESHGHLKFYLYALMSQDAMNDNTKQLSKFRKLHPRGFVEYRYPHFRKSQEFALGGRVALNILSKIADFYTGEVLISAL